MSLYNDYRCNQELTCHDGIKSICVLDDGTIEFYLNEQSIAIGDYTIKNAHDGSLFNVFTLPNNIICIIFIPLCL